MIRGFKYRFYPTPEQVVALARTFGSCRFVYNWALNLRTQAWYERQERINYYRSSAELTKLKQQPETAWLNEVSCIPTQQALRHLQTAFVRFWEKRAGYPSFKKKGGRETAVFTRFGFKWDGTTISLTKIGALRVKWSRRFTAEPSTVIVSRTPSGRYYVIFWVDEPLAVMPQVQDAIGIDLGLLDFAATSNGSKYQSPRPLKRKMAQLKRAQQALARKQKGSKNRAKARGRVAKIHEKIADIRQDFLHKLSTKLVRENQTIVIEDLNVRGMMANHSLAGAIGKAGWSEFTRQIGYKCEWYGRRLVKTDRWFPSSKRCSQCGHIADSMPLNVRQWECLSCGVKHDRDVNAAKNILAAGLAVTACGEGVRPSRPQGRGGNPRRSRNRLVGCAQHVLQ